jgi:hypothetical protein
MEVLKFIFKNERNLYVSDIYGFLDEIDNNFEARYYFYEELYENLMTAFDMNLDYKFYIPRKRYKELTDEDVKKYISYVKGFNENRVKNFLAEEEVINFEKFNEVISNAKIIKGNVKDNIELYGIYSNKVVLPKIDEQLSTLINIHEFTHYSLIDNQEKFLIDDWIVNGEDIPIFYELLFKENNSFIDIDIHTTNKALELLKAYNNEPFEEQIKKLKRIK